MSDSRNNACSNTPNTAIHCTVTQCTHHCSGQQFCGLNSIRVGTHELNPSKDQCTDCLSFQKN